jgi:hypothetical protein
VVIVVLIATAAIASSLLLGFVTTHAGAVVVPPLVEWVRARARPLTATAIASSFSVDDCWRLRRREEGLVFFWIL